MKTYLQALQYAQNVPKPKIIQRIKKINNKENKSAIVSESIIPLDQNIAELQVFECNFHDKICNDRFNNYSILYLYPLYRDVMNKID